jgi:hypothetical protein
MQTIFFFAPARRPAFRTGQTGDFPELPGDTTLQAVQHDGFRMDAATPQRIMHRAKNSVEAFVHTSLMLWNTEKFPTV